MCYKKFKKILKNNMKIHERIKLNKLIEFKKKEKKEKKKLKNVVGLIKDGFDHNTK